MYSARVNKIRNFLYSLPLAMCLALSTFLVTMLTLLVLSGVLKCVISASMQEEYKTHIDNHIAEMREILIDRAEEHSAISQKITDKWIEAELENWPYYTRLLSKNGKLLGESQNMPFTSAQIYSIVPEDKEEIYYKADNNMPYMILKESVYIGSNFVGQIQVVRDFSAEERTQNKLDDAFLAMTVFGGILTVFFTLLLSKKTLKPVQRMQAKINTIGVSSLGVRLKQNPWPRELKPIAHAFDNLLDEIEDNFNRLSQFSSDIAHELRTPLHKIMVELDVTLSAPRSEQEYRRTLENLQESVHSGAKMLYDMLFIARAENKVSALKTTELDAAAVVAKLTDFLQILLDEKGLKFKIDVSGKVKADEAMFVRALSNLISNAVRHSPQGGIIEVNAKSGRNGFIISVEDSGAGIAHKDLPHLFDRFFKADAARGFSPNNEGGTGLGLAIVKSVMSMHGGTAVARNRASGGASFTLTFPK